LHFGQYGLGTFLGHVRELLHLVLLRCFANNLIESVSFFSVFVKGF
jgi:hypothetical protein